MGGQRKVRKITYGTKWVVFPDYGGARGKGQPLILSSSLSESQVKNFVENSYPGVPYNRERLENSVVKKKPAPAALASEAPSLALEPPVEMEPDKGSQ